MYETSVVRAQWLSVAPLMSGTDFADMVREIVAAGDWYALADYLIDFTGGSFQCEQLARAIRGT